VSAESKNLNRKSVEFVHKGKPRASMSHKEYKEPLQWLMPVIPATREAELVGSWFEASLGKIRKT
jgi:hypothetical protein